MAGICICVHGFATIIALMFSLACFPSKSFGIEKTVSHIGIYHNHNQKLHFLALGDITCPNESGILFIDCIGEVNCFAILLFFCGVFFCFVFFLFFFCVCVCVCCFFFFFVCVFFFSFFFFFFVCVFFFSFFFFFFFFVVVVVVVLILLMWNCSMSCGLMFDSGSSEGFAVVSLYFTN